MAGDTPTAAATVLRVTRGTGRTLAPRADPQVSGGASARHRQRLDAGSPVEDAGALEELVAGEVAGREPRGEDLAAPRAPGSAAGGPTAGRRAGRCGAGRRACRGRGAGRAGTSDLRRRGRVRRGRPSGRAGRRRSAVGSVWWHASTMTARDRPHIGRQATPRVRLLTYAGYARGRMCGGRRGARFGGPDVSRSTREERRDPIAPGAAARRGARAGHRLVLLGRGARPLDADAGGAVRRTRRRRGPAAVDRAATAGDRSVAATRRSGSSTVSWVAVPFLAAARGRGRAALAVAAGRLRGLRRRGRRLLRRDVLLRPGAARRWRSPSTRWRSRCRCGAGSACSSCWSRWCWPRTTARPTSARSTRSSTPSS